MNRTKQSTGTTIRHGRAALLALTLAIAAGGPVGLASAGEDAAARAKDAAAIDVATSLSAAFRSAAARIDPSVVSIMVTKKAESPMMVGGPELPEEFKRFFGGRLPGAQLPSQPRSMPKARGEGSGVIVSDDGRILTNNHVIHDAETITVKLSDGRELPAALTGADPETDLAVIKIEASGLTAARIGSSDALQPGDWVVAVGSPFGLDHTVTAGVVSAKSRADVGLNTFEDFIQTDAAINPGNSGGPLINLRGEVVGINSAIRSAGGGNNGIGFAIPSSTFVRVMDSLIASGKVERGYLGVSTQALTADLATSLNADNPRGALVAEVVPDAPADKAGLRSGDIITAVNGRTVGSSRELVNTVGGLSPGEEAAITILRDGKPTTVTVNLGTRPTKGATAPATDPSTPTLGLSLQKMNDDLAKQLGMKDARGVLIAEVEDGSPAAEAGLESGHVILQAGGKDVENPADVAAAAKAAKDGKGLLLKVRHQNTTRFVVVKTGR
ncbi:MAG: Do family serine endopeptidase [Phycisphaerae bacterium]|nr:Do family serine endopeptidase [Phycisphaerae bacterium]